MSRRKARLVILISGNGSNLQAIIDAIKQGEINAEIALVCSNQAKAFGLQRAQQANIPTAILSGKDFADREAYDLALQNLLEQAEPDLIILAGFMRILSPAFVNAFKGKIINIHPSLLPKYKGLHTHQRVLEAGDKIHGVTVHYVTADLDDGPIIQQVTLDVLPDDTIESLEQRIHQIEHQLYPQVIASLV